MTTRQWQLARKEGRKEGSEEGEGNREEGGEQTDTALSIEQNRRRETLVFGERRPKVSTMDFFPLPQILIIPVRSNLRKKAE